MTIVFSVIAAVSCGALGVCAAGVLKKRVVLLYHYMEVLERLRAKIILSRVPLLRALSESGDERLMEAARLAEEAPPHGPDHYFEEMKKPDELPPDAEAALQNLLRALCTGSEDTQEIALNFALDRMHFLHDRAEESRAKNARLYASLGWLSGLALFLMLC